MDQANSRVHPNKAVKVVSADSITASNPTTFFLVALRTHFYQAGRKASGKGDRCKKKCFSTFECCKREKEKDLVKPLQLVIVLMLELEMWTVTGRT